jgi:hypothetical protein
MLSIRSACWLILGASGCAALAQQVLWDNGPLITPTCGDGVVTSEVQIPGGYAGQNINTLTKPPTEAADDFQVPPGVRWQITRITIFAYQPGVDQPLKPGTFKLYYGDAMPEDDAFFSIITGGSEFTGIYRNFNGYCETDRPIYTAVAELTEPLELPGGRYWLSATIPSIFLTGPFVPNVTIPGLLGKPGGNAHHFLGKEWEPINAHPSDQFIPQDFPFVIEGVILPDRCIADINADGVVNESDLGILLGEFGCASRPPLVCASDLDGNGVVDQIDLGVLLGNFAQPCR